MKIPIWAASAILLSFQAVTAGGEEVPAAGGSAESLAAAEKAFAQEAAEKGTRTAFLHALADDAIVFEPSPQNGKKAWEAKPESHSLLEWQPVLAGTSTSGDLGYTTGPWSLKTKASDARATAFGQFVSIWRWEGGGWKLIFDLGSSNPAPTGPPPELFMVRNHAPAQPADDAQAVMLAHDRRYLADRAGNLAVSGEENVRLYLPGKFPITEREAAVSALRGMKEPIKFGEPKAGISGGGDLGYLWGEYTLGTGPQPTGYYLRIWRRNRAGEWNLALDLLHPR